MLVTKIVFFFFFFEFILTVCLNISYAGILILQIYPFFCNSAKSFPAKVSDKALVSRNV